MLQKENISAGTPAVSDSVQLCLSLGKLSR